MAQQKKRFLDVWLVEPNTVYREVPFTVVADWVSQSRLLPDDMLRPSGTAQWFKVGASPDFAPYVPRSQPYRVDDQAEALDAVQLDFAWKRRHEDEDEDVDMIPLIDVSLVLLIFFVMTLAGAAASAVNINTPGAVNGRRTPDELIYVGITLDDDRQPVYSLGVGKRRAEINTGSLPELLRTLDAKLKEEGERREVTIKAEKRVEEGVVLDVLVELSKRVDKVSRKWVTVSEKGE